MTSHRLFLQALAILAGILAVAAALAFSADIAHGTQVPVLEETEHSFDPLEPPGTTPGTTPEAPPEANETEAHLPQPAPVRVAPRYAG